jgi:hypothetical protein
MSAATASVAPTHNSSHDTPGAAAIIGVAEGTLRNWRSRDEGPAYHRCGKRIIYLQADLDRYLASCRVEPTR